VTAVNANIASPRLILVAGGAVRQIAEVLGKFGLSRPLVVTDPFMMTSGHVQHCLEPLVAAGIAVTVFSDTVPDPTDTAVETGVAELAKGDYDCLIGFGGGSPSTPRRRWPSWQPVAAKCATTRRRSPRTKRSCR